MADLFKQKTPKDVEDRIRRGRARLEQVAPERTVCWEYLRDNPYAYVDEKNIVQHQPTVTTVRGGGKKPWRARTKRNLLIDVVAHEVSAATQRVPSFEVVPSSADGEDQSAAGLSQKVIYYGYEKWGIDLAAAEAVTHVVVGGEAFAWVYFDNTVGPFIKTDDGRIGEGEIKVRIYGGNEVFWEPGVKYHESAWHAVEHARPLEQVQADYADKKLIADADTGGVAGKGQTEAKETKMVLVTEYLERPTPEKPNGRWLCMANGRPLGEERRYPGDGDEPVLRKLSYFVDPANDRDMGLAVHLLGAIRTRLDCINKLIEAKNGYMMPRMFVTPGLLRKQRITDEPNSVYEVPMPDQNVKFFPQPEPPEALFRILDQADSDIAKIASQGDPPSGVESGRAFATWFENNRERRADFLKRYAKWNQEVARDGLALAAVHYSENRLLHIRGRAGWEPIRDFKGAQLRNQVDVRVNPASIEPRTKADVERRVMTFAQLGWVTPEVAMAAIQNGTAEGLIDDYDNDVAWARRRMTEIRLGPEAFFGKAGRPMVQLDDPLAPADPNDPYFKASLMEQRWRGENGKQPLPANQVPAWLPREAHNIRILKATFESWLKTEEFEQLDPAMQEVTELLYDVLLGLEAKKAARAQMAQQAEAEKLGMVNASAPQTGKQLPSFPGLPGMEPVGAEQNGGAA